MYKLILFSVDLIGYVVVDICNKGDTCELYNIHNRGITTYMCTL